MRDFSAPWVCNWILEAVLIHVTKHLFFDFYKILCKLLTISVPLLTLLPLI